MTQTVDSRRMILGVRRRWWLILLLALVGAGAGFAGSAWMRPVYQATTSILVGQSLQAPDLNREDIETSRQLALTYADFVRREPVLAGVADVLGLRTSWQTLRDQVRVDLAPENGQLIVVKVEAGSPGEAEAIAAAIADQLIKLSPSRAERKTGSEIQAFVRDRLETLQSDIRRAQKQVATLQSELAATRAERRREDLRLQIEANQRLIIAWLQNYSSLLEFPAAEESPNSLQVMERADAIEEPVRPNVVLNTELAAGVGLFLALGIVYLLESRGAGWWAALGEPTAPGVGRDRPARLPESDVLMTSSDDRSDLDPSQHRASGMADSFAYGPSGRHRA